VNSSKGGLALLAARIAGVKRILFTAHGFAFNEKRPRFQKALIRAAYVVTVLLSHETICVSEAVRRDIAFPLLGGKLRVIRNGIDAPAYRAKRSARNILRPTDAKRTWLGMIAELHPTKRVEDAILAMTELSPEFPELELIVLGEGEERAKLEALIKERGLGERVRLLGFVPDAASYLPAFDLFLMISRSEALGYALLEAGAAGLPVVATRVGGMPEIVAHGESGILVPPENPAALARAIRGLLADPALGKRYGAALKEKVATRFSKERMLEETFARYHA
jgi:glycosyltransferase involved in cell wall biosynthesis